MRSQAREVVFKYVFSRLFNPSDEGLFDVLLQTLEKNEDKEFAKSLYSAYSIGTEKYDAAISDLLKNYKFDRVFNADKCAVKIGMAERETFPETPLPVVIDEAVKLAANFSTEKSTDFVNGILAAYFNGKN